MCRNIIEKPSDAVVMFGPVPKRFMHVSCAEGYIHSFPSWIELFGIGMKGKDPSDKRKAAQRRMGAYVGNGFLVLEAGMLLFFLSLFFTLKISNMDAIMWLIFLMLGAYALILGPLQQIRYREHVYEHEKLLAKPKAP
jgi:hypothetical protein